ncbi:MAG: SH3 domain-containing protein [Nostocaceae cyanobacterium]|nr:SH3 domain-containing protein [Nostocaceae cyanobacterium]
MLVNILKYILGFILAMAVLAGSGFAAAVYIMNRTAILPEKPVFNNDKPSVKAQAQRIKAQKTENDTSKSTSANQKPDSSQSKSKPKKPPETAKPKEPAKSSDELPQGAYKARVTWPQGLSIREKPSLNSQRLGGVAFNRRVIVLKISQDKAWQRIRVEGNDQEGWVKAGNTKRIN